MNKLKLLLAGLLLSGLRTMAQTPSNDIVWKATFNYYLVMDKPDTMFANMGMPVESFTISHLTVNNEKGNMESMLHDVLDQLKQHKQQLWGINAFSNTPEFAHELTMDSYSNKDVDGMTMIIDTMMDKNGKIKVIKTDKKLNGISMNEEWFYNRKTNKIDVGITDVGLLWNHELAGMNTDYLRGALKYSWRSFQEPMGPHIDNPDVAWVKGFYTYFDYDSLKGARLVYANPKVKTSFNGVMADCETGYPYNMKTTYDKTLASWLYDAARLGELEAYKYEKNGGVGAKLSKDDLKNLITTIDTLQDENGNSKIVQVVLDHSDLAGLEVVKEITFNKSTFRLESKILRVAIVKKEMSEMTGQYTSKCIPVFWIKFD